MREKIFLLLVLLTFPVVALGQTDDDREYHDVNVPDRIMEQVVKRILIGEFKARKKSKAIYLLNEGIKRSWLPSIKNINFQLVERNYPDDIYFFQKPELSGKTYRIGFGFGAPFCDASGDYWVFRLSRRRVKLRRSVGFGMACSNSTS